MKSRSTKKDFLSNALTVGFEYTFWGSILFGLCLINFSEFMFDAFHIILSIIITWLLVGLFFTRRFAKVDTLYFISENKIKRYLQDRFPKIYFSKNSKEIIVADINEGFWFSRKRIFIIVKKERIGVNIKTLGRFDIPSIFHALSNFKKAKSIAKELVQQ